jgi:hypothetical protein
MRGPLKAQTGARPKQTGALPPQAGADPQPCGAHSRDAGEGAPMQFAAVLVLSKREAFDLCEACAEAERALLRSGRASEAARMAGIFELVEGRLVLQGR